MSISSRSGHINNNNIIIINSTIIVKMCIGGGNNNNNDNNKNNIKNRSDTPYGRGNKLSEWMRLLKERLEQRPQEQISIEGGSNCIASCN